MTLTLLAKFFPVASWRHCDKVPTPSYVLQGPSWTNKSDRPSQTAGQTATGVFLRSWPGSHLEAGKSALCHFTQVPKHLELSNFWNMFKMRIQMEVQNSFIKHSHPLTPNTLLLLISVLGTGPSSHFQAAWCGNSAGKSFAQVWPRIVRAPKSNFNCRFYPWNLRSGQGQAEQWPQARHALKPQHCLGIISPCGHRKIVEQCTNRCADKTISYDTFPACTIWVTLTPLNSRTHTCKMGWSLGLSV